jgi:hypothetical protein
MDLEGSGYGLTEVLFWHWHVGLRTSEVWVCDIIAKPFHLKGNQKLLVKDRPLIENEFIVNLKMKFEFFSSLLF